MTMTAAELVASKKHILLDFDGPICAAFAGYGAANISRQLAMLIEMDGTEVPPELFATSDPFELLHYAASLGDTDVLIDIDGEFRRLEVQAVRIAEPTPHAVEVIRALSTTDHTVTIVSNNSTEAVETYARRHHITPLLAGVSGRTSPDPSLLKPNPHLLLAALSQRGAAPGDSVMVGDSASDIEAAVQAGVSSIALANKPGKREKLAAAHPDIVIQCMSSLVES